jgi:hypothetical protein
MAVCLGVWLPSGCRRAAPGARSGDAPDGAQVARTEIERGPVRVTLEFTPQPARLSDEPKLTLTIECQRGVQVTKPPFGEAVGDFLIRDFQEPLPEVKGDREILRQVYTLEPTRTGKQQIEPIAVNFTDSRPDGDGKPHTAETEALAVEVISSVDGDAPSLDRLQALAGPIALPAPASTARWWVAAVVVAVAGLGAAAVLVLRRRRPAPERQLTPQELAYLELQQLLEQDLSRRDVKLFYVELTGIVRRFIERTTGIHAPEQTTEEFLREIQAGTTFAQDERSRLAAFLEAADLVKFAALEPAPLDVEETFERAKRFLGLGRNEVAA